MEVRSYNQELVYANMLFKRPFSNIEIESNGKRKTVQCVFGNRSRIMKNLENPDRRGQFSLPMIVIQRTGIQKNDQRLANVWNEVKYRSGKNRMNYNLFTPVPIDISYQVTILSKYQSDVDMIISNFIPFFNKDLFFQVTHPKFKDIQWKNQVIMENGIQEQRLDQIDATMDEIVSATCTFTYKTFLFCGTMKSKKVVTTQISNVISVMQSGSTSSMMYELNDDDIENIKDFMQKNNNRKLSTIIDIPITVDVSTMVPIEISTEEDVYEGLIPQINQIGIGWYDTSTLSTHGEFMNYYDMLSATGYDDKPGVDRFILKIEDNLDMSYESPYPSKDWDWDGYEH